MNRIALSTTDGYGEPAAGWFDKDSVTHEFDETSRWDGNNHISNATRSQWEHEKLYVTRKGRFILHHWSQWSGSTPYYTEITPGDAAMWLVCCEHEIPDDLPGLSHVNNALEATEV
jgi:hypothetical protein